MGEAIDNLFKMQKEPEVVEPEVVKPEETDTGEDADEETSEDEEIYEDPQAWEPTNAVIKAFGTLGLGLLSLLITRDYGPKPVITLSVAICSYSLFYRNFSKYYGIFRQRTSMILSTVDSMGEIAGIDAPIIACRWESEDGSAGEIWTVENIKQNGVIKLLREEDRVGKLYLRFDNGSIRKISVNA